MTNYPTVSWDETSPANTDNASQGDDRIRELKTQIREVVGVDHDFPSSGQATDNGQHKQVTLQEQADLGSGAVGTTILGNQTIGGKGELVYTDEDDNDIQITNDGAIYLDAGKVSNNTYIKSVNAAGSGTVNLIKADASNVTVIPDGTQTATDAAPNEDKDVANKKYVDDAITAADKSLGAWDASSYAAGTSYEAPADGFVVAYGVNFDIKTDSSNPPTTTRFSWTSASITCGGCVPVKSGDRFLVSVNATNVFWIPLS